LHSLDLSSLTRTGEDLHHHGLAVRDLFVTDEAIQASGRPPEEVDPD
jgi:hypothetical protein